MADRGGWPEPPALDAANYRMLDVATLGLTGAEMLPEAGFAIERRLASADPVEGSGSETLQTYDNDGRGRVVLTQDGLPDDSVRTQQHVVEFDLRPGAQVEGRVLAMPTGYGVRQRCYRAADPDAWTNAPCP